MEKLRRGIGLLLIIIGVGIILNIAYNKFQTAQKQKELIEVFQSQIVDEEAESTDEEVDDKDTMLNNVNGVVPVAILEIPSIDLTQVIAEGITENVIQYYLGKFPESVMPGEIGNFSVAGHRVSSYADVFVNLHKVTEGDEIIVQTLDGKYLYEVTDNFIVQPNEVYVLDHTEEATITLITCTVQSTERVIVTGKLIAEETE